jgi:hypothetical protein
MATVTLACYRRILNGAWRPKIGAIRFLDVRYSTLVKIADEANWSKKSYNNAISVLRRAFKFGYRDYPEELDPTSNLRSARIRKQDRPVVDPFKSPLWVAKQHGHTITTMLKAYAAWTEGATPSDIQAHQARHGIRPDCLRTHGDSKSNRDGRSG